MLAGSIPIALYNSVPSVMYSGVLTTGIVMPFATPNGDMMGTLIERGPGAYGESNDSACMNPKNASVLL